MAPRDKQETTRSIASVEIVNHACGEFGRHGERFTAIHDKLYNLIAHVQKLKIERGIETARAIRQWKKDTKERYPPWTLQMGKIEKTISQRRIQRKSKTKSSERKPTNRV